MCSSDLGIRWYCLSISCYFFDDDGWVMGGAGRSGASGSGGTDDARIDECGGICAGIIAKHAVVGRWVGRVVGVGRCRPVCDDSHGFVVIAWRTNANESYGALS